MASNKEFIARRVASFEDDMVVQIVKFREDLRNLEKTKISIDLRNMDNAEHPVFTSWSAEEMSRLSQVQHDISVVLNVSDIRDPGFSKRVLKRVQKLEAILAGNFSVAPSATEKSE